MPTSSALNPCKLAVIAPDGTQVELCGHVELVYDECWDCFPDKEYIVRPYPQCNINIDDKATSMLLTKKKFIKLLMAKGIGSNGAHELAKYFCKKRGRYSLADVMLF